MENYGSNELHGATIIRCDILQKVAAIRGDVIGGATAAVVLPLSLAFGIASGAGAVALYGTISAVWWRQYWRLWCTNQGRPARDDRGLGGYCQPAWGWRDVSGGGWPV